MPNNHRAIDGDLRGAWPEPVRERRTIPHETEIPFAIEIAT
jgi:hypothetical protein